jgi:hypothetical protein
MTFDPNIPQPGDLQSDSQGDLLNNNIALDASFENDHTKFSDTTANNGLHKRVSLYQVAVDPPSPPFAFPASVLYSKNGGTTPNQTTNLYYATKPETGSPSYLQLTGNMLIESGSDGRGGTYSLFRTPWGVKIFMGKTNQQKDSHVFTLSGTQAFGTTIFTAQASIATPLVNDPSMNSFTPNATLKTFTLSTGNLSISVKVDVYWFVITSET